MDEVVDVQQVREAKRECERRILDAVNALERQTGLECRHIELSGQTTAGGRVLTALVTVELVLR